MSSSKGRKILLCLDLSEHSARALSWYLADFHAEGDDVTLFHVLEPPSLKGTCLGMTNSSSSGKEYDVTMGQVQHEFEDLKRLFEKQIQDIVPREKAHVVSATGSNPGELMHEYMKENKLDLVIVGNRGRGKARRVFLGSVSEYIMHHAHCPIAIVPPANEDCHNHQSTASLNVDSISLRTCEDHVSTASQEKHS